jgi:hypothetical protein
MGYLGKFMMQRTLSQQKLPKRGLAEQSGGKCFSSRHSFTLGFVMNA